MENFDKIIFQYYSGNIKNNQVQGLISLKKFIESTRKPQEKHIVLFDRISKAEIVKDFTTKRLLKEQLYSFTPCVIVNRYRKYACIVRFTGLLVLDFDHIEYSSEFKEFLFNEYPQIICCWLSPSKKGVKAFVKIPVVNSVDEFKSYYFGISDEMNQYNGFDTSGQNSVLPLFQSYDAEILFRNNPTTWTTTGINPKQFVENLGNYNPVEVSSKNEKLILKFIDSGLKKINDNGHPQLIRLCVAIGGYVANNYIDFNTALQYIKNKITSHTYLKKGVSGYTKTAKTAMLKGMSSPLNIESYEK